MARGGIEHLGVKDESKISRDSDVSVDHSECQRVHTHRSNSATMCCYSAPLIVHDRLLDPGIVLGFSGVQSDGGSRQATGRGPDIYRTIYGSVYTVHPENVAP